MSFDSVTHTGSGAQRMKMPWAAVFRAASVKWCEKIAIRPRQGPQRVAGGERSETPG